MALSAQIGDIVPQAYEIHCVGPGRNTQLHKQIKTNTLSVKKENYSITDIRMISNISDVRKLE